MEAALHERAYGAMITYHNDPDLTGQLLTFTHRRESGDPVRILLAEGDSWFSLGGATSNLLMALDNSDTLIVSCAYPGDTLRNVSSMCNKAFRRLLSPRYGIKWDAVLLSAGGNDMLGDIRQILSGSNLNEDLLDLALGDIVLGYQRIIAAVREHHACPIHAHTYDYITSDPHGGWFRMGPWIGNRLNEAGVARHLHAGIIVKVIDALADRLMHIGGLTVHDTRGTLTLGTWGRFGWTRHYRNEMHPTSVGYRLLAARWNV